MSCTDSATQSATKEKRHAHYAGRLMSTRERHEVAILCPGVRQRLVRRLQTLRPLILVAVLERPSIGLQLFPTRSGVDID